MSELQNISFPCTKCGACCRRIGKIVINARILVQESDPQPMVIDFANFPHRFNEMGRCEHLQEDDTCAIYDTRPEICNMKKTHDKYNPAQPISDYYLQAAMTCNVLMAQEGLESDKYIDIEKWEQDNRA